MASLALPPRKKKSRQPAPTTILALGDDLLRKVFLRLPSLPSLVRAALACPVFLRAVRSSPTFRRRFRDLHSPTILGAFLVNDESPMPTFAPIRLRRGRRSDPDLAAALRGLDVYLTRLVDAIGDKEDAGEDAEDGEKESEEGTVDEEDDGDGGDAEDKESDSADGEDAEDQSEEDAEDVDEDEDEEDDWYMSGCRDGYVILVKPRWNTKKVAVYDPLTGALHLFPAPPDEVFSGDSEYTEAEFHVIPSKADDRSFRVLCVPKDGGEQIAVLSPDTREWQIIPTAGSLQDAGNVTVLNGLVYWADADGENTLNTETLQFSQIDLPTVGSGCLGETNDGKLCFVRAFDDNLELDVRVRRAGADGVEKWRRDMRFQLPNAIDKLALNIVAECPSLNVVSIVGGTVYLSIHQNEPPNWLLSFCLETREVKKPSRITSSEFCYPYIMAWPPSLVRNKDTKKFDSRQPNKLEGN